MTKDRDKGTAGIIVEETIHNVENIMILLNVRVFQKFSSTSTWAK